MFPAAIAAIADAQLPEGSAIVIEKPFGHDLASAQALNALLATAAPESAIHRVDHFLEKQTVQNVLGLRFANRIFEPIWNREHIEKVEIIWDETLALEGRASYYDRAGALRDMIQNHLLQVMALVAMEPPPTLHERDLRDRKVDVLRAVRTPTAARDRDARRCAPATPPAPPRNGPVPDYVDEDGRRPGPRRPRPSPRSRCASTTGAGRTCRSCCAAARPSATSVPSTWRSTSARCRTSPSASGRHAQPNLLIAGPRARPAGAVGEHQRPGRRRSTSSRSTLVAELAPQEVSAYGKVILDVLHCDPTLSIRGDEAEEGWRIVEPILRVVGRRASRRSRSTRPAPRADRLTLLLSPPVSGH